MAEEEEEEAPSNRGRRMAGGSRKMHGGAIEAGIFTKLAADTRSFFPLPAGYGTGV